MKKTSSVIIGVVVIAGIACVALPKYYSSQNKIFIQNFLTTIQQDSNGQLIGTVIKENDGWFSSTSTIQFNYKLTNALADNIPINGQFDLQLTTKYGPFLITQSGLQIGQAYLQYTLQNNQQSAKYFSDPLLNGHTLINLVGNTQTQFFGFKSLALPNFHFDGATVAASVNKSMNQASGTINYGTLQASNPNNNSENIQIKPFTQTFNLNRVSATDLWTGNKNLDIPNMLIQCPGFHGQFNHISLKSNVTLDQHFLNGNLTITTPDFTVNNQHGNYQATLTLNNLNADALSKIRALANTINPQEATADVLQNFALQLTHDAIDVFAGKSVVQFNSTLNLDTLGSLIVNSGYDNSTTTSAINFTAKLLRANKEFAGVDLNILGLNKNALGQLLHLGINLNSKLNTTAEQDMQNSTQLQSTVNHLISQLFTAASQIHLNIVMPENDKSGFQLLDAKAYFNQLPQNPSTTDLMTQAQLDASWKIPTYATEMLKIFAPIVINKIEDPTDQADANTVYNLFQQMLPLMIQQGYLVQQGNYYLSNWNITSKAVLMNNKPVLPLLTQLKQLQQQTATTPATAAPAPSGTAADSIPSVPIKD